MFKFLQAMRVRRSYLWVSALLFEMLGSGWLDMKVACSGAEHPRHLKRPSSSLPSLIPGQTSRRMKVDRTNSVIQVEANNPFTPSSAVSSPSASYALPTQTPSSTITPMTSIPTALSTEFILEQAPKLQMPSSLVLAIWRLRSLKIIDVDCCMT
ncbi:hypothetical protein NEHOM01_2225 [Nematocida homosporus]|uniref:uncharacterized protein n=1 Tax=Nematocida homosporus TaxID=1912981 RepID=UPI00221E9FCE|nr:uncharacterized protein NEHOM01_2225 [Nematocida homosporus]KAI5187502.1 hypothetical protein NEHOM01_2225 [Nematocida homosporus]